MAGDAILGVVKSFSGARWVPARSSLLASEIDRCAAALVETFDDLPLPIARLMTSLQQSKPRIMWIKTGSKAPFGA